MIDESNPTFFWQVFSLVIFIVIFRRQGTIRELFSTRVIQMTKVPLILRCNHLATPKKILSENHVINTCTFPTKKVCIQIG